MRVDPDLTQESAEQAYKGSTYKSHGELASQQQNEQNEQLLVAFESGIDMPFNNASSSTIRKHERAPVTDEEWDLALQGYAATVTLIERGVTHE